MLDVAVVPLRPSTRQVWLVALVPLLMTSVVAADATPVAAPRPVGSPAVAAARGTSAPGSAAPARSPAPAGAAVRSEPAAARVFSIARPTWIYPEPRRTDRPVGSIRLGQSVSLREAAPRRGEGCSGGFVAVQPFGFVCLDAAATLDGDDRFVRSMRELAPGPGVLPFHYALSNGAPTYRRLPSRAEWEREERFLGAPGTFGALSWGNRGHERLAEVRSLAPTGAPPSFLEAGGSAGSAHPTELVRRLIPLGSMVAYRDTFEQGGRTWLASADGTIVPADRVRPFRVSTFHGVELQGDLTLPLAWFRASPRPQYVRQGENGFAATGTQWEARSFVGLAEGLRSSSGADGRRYLLTRARRGAEPLWAAEADATVIEARPKLPWGVAEDEKWIDVSITRGTLVAYVGLRPVFATLISPGAGGVPVPGADPVRASTTPTGVHRITYKYRWQTMSPDVGEERTFWIADVPNAQYFSPPFALHTAYWHESFGEPMSAGCINLSPVDGAWLFGWTEPRVPPEWEGAAPHALTGKGTVVVVRR
jgi:hypothetical protein